MFVRFDLIKHCALLISIFAIALALPNVNRIASAEEGDVGIFCEGDVGIYDHHHFHGTFRVPASKDSIDWISAGPHDFLTDFSASTSEYTFQVYAEVGDSKYDLRLHINRVTLELRIDRLKAQLRYPDLPVFDPRNDKFVYEEVEHTIGSCKRVKLNAPI